MSSFRRFTSGKVGRWLLLGMPIALTVIVVVHHSLNRPGNSSAIDPEPVVLTVTAEGHVLVAPDRLFTTPREVAEYLRGLAREARSHNDKDHNFLNHIFLTAIILPDGETPFIRDPLSHQPCVHDIIWACRFAGYDQVLLGIQSARERERPSLSPVRWVAPFHTERFEISVEVQEKKVNELADTIQLQSSFEPNKRSEPLRFGSEDFRPRLQSQLAEMRGNCISLSINPYNNMKYKILYEIFEIAIRSGFDRFQLFLVPVPAR